MVILCVEGSNVLLPRSLAVLLMGLGCFATRHVHATCLEVGLQLRLDLVHIFVGDS